MSIQNPIHSGIQLIVHNATKENLDRCLSSRLAFALSIPSPVLNFARRGRSTLRPLRFIFSFPLCPYWFPVLAFLCVLTFPLCSLRCLAFLLLFSPPYGVGRGWGWGWVEIHFLVNTSSTNVAAASAYKI